MAINPFIPIEEVDPEKMKLLQSYIYVRLLRNGVKKSLVHELFRENFFSDEYGPLQDLAYSASLKPKPGLMSTAPLSENSKKRLLRS